MKYISTIWVVLGIFISTIFTSSCSSETQSKNVSDKDSTNAIPVEIAKAHFENVSAYYSSTTTLEADEEATVVSKVRGIIKEIHVEEGDFVTAGTVLTQLEDEQLELEAQRAKATMDRLKNELNRKEELFQKGLISVQEFENAKYEYQAQKSDYQLAKLRLDYSKIKAPINGIISKRLVKVGNMIKTDQEVFKITDFDPLLAIINVPEHEMDKIEKEQLALIQVDAVTGKTFEGKVIRISPIVDPETGTFKVTVGINDESGQLKPGMFGRVRIVYDTHENTLTIPKNAVIDEDGVTSVFIINNKMAFRKNIQTGYSNGDNIEVLEGLNPSDSVVTIGQSSLRDSSSVEVVSF